MKFKFFLKVNSYPFARNFKNQGAQGENLKMAVYALLYIYNFLN